MPKAEAELLVIDKMYALMIWLDQRIESFPRRRQHTLGDRLDRRANEILEGLLKAKYTTNRADILRDVNLHLELLRFQLRAAKDQRCLSLSGYGFAARSVNEIGRLVGSWLKKASR